MILVRYTIHQFAIIRSHLEETAFSTEWTPNRIYFDLDGVERAHLSLNRP